MADEILTQLEALRQRNQAAIEQGANPQDMGQGFGDEPRIPVVQPQAETPTQEVPLQSFPASSPTSAETQLGNAQVAANEEQEGALEALRLRNMQAMAGDQPDKGAVHNFLAGANDTFAKGVALPFEVINDVQRLVHSAIGTDPNEPGVVAAGKPGDTYRQVKGLMDKLGIDTNAQKGFFSELGSNAMSGAATFGGMSTLATKMANFVWKGGNNVATRVINDIGKYILRNPGKAAITEAGGIAGGTAGKELTGGSALGELAGSMAGASTAAGVAGTVEAGGKLIFRGARRLMGRTSGPPAPAEAIRDPLTDPQRAQTFSEQQVEGAKLRLDKVVENAIEAVPTTGTPAQVQTRVNNLIDRAEEIGNRIVGEFWSRVPLKERIPMSGVRKDVAQMRADLKDTPSVAPTEFMNKLSTLASPIRGPDGRMTQSLPTVQRLRDLRNEIRVARLTEEGNARFGKAVNDGLVRNYNRLEGIIDDNIQAALPGDVTIQQARNMSIKYHDIFSRGGLRDIMARKATGEDVVAPGQTVEHLMDRFGGMQDLLNAGKTLSNVPRIPGVTPLAYPTVATQAEKNDLKQMVVETENAVRSMFREAAASKGPMEAAKFVRQNENNIKGFSKVATELKDAATTIELAHQERKVIEKSALARFSQSTAEKAIQSVFSSRNPAQTAKELMVSFRGDQDALNALRAGVIDEALIRTGQDPNRLRGLLNSPQYSNLLETVLSTDQMDRLRKVVGVTNQIIEGDEQSLRKTVASFSVLGRIVGAQLGRGVAQITGGGTVQTPGILANAGRKFVENIFRSTEPKDLMVNAIVDPRWEKILLARAPTTTKEMRQMERRFRGFAKTLSAGIVHFTPASSGDAEEGGQ